MVESIQALKLEYLLSGLKIEFGGAHLLPENGIDIFCEWKERKQCGSARDGMSLVGDGGIVRPAPVRFYIVSVFSLLFKIYARMEVVL
jgi:hypothetical protein